MNIFARVAPNLWDNAKLLLPTGDRLLHPFLAADLVINKSRADGD